MPLLFAYMALIRNGSNYDLIIFLHLTILDDYLATIQPELIKFNSTQQTGIQ